MQAINLRQVIFSFNSSHFFHFLLKGMLKFKYSGILLFIILNFSLRAQNNLIWQERNGLVVIEPEDISPLNGWVVKDSVKGFTGRGYLVWTGNQFFNTPTNGRLTFRINITTTGRYALDWRTLITFGTIGTEHNDTWLNISGVDNFYAEKSSITPASLVKPSPECNNNAIYKCPNGTSASSYFKIYTGGRVNTYLWQAHTSDNDPHLIFFEKKTPGVITINIAARSSYHGLDRIVLYKTPDVTATTARNLSLDQQNYISTITSIDESINDAFKVYPNPTKYSTIVEVPQKVELDFVDIQGKIIKSQVLNAGKHVLDTHFLRTGTYLMRFKIDKIIKVHKMIVE
jgi:hypothetical protein